LWSPEPINLLAKDPRSRHRRENTAPLPVTGALRAWITAAQRAGAQNRIGASPASKKFLKSGDFNFAARCASERALRSASSEAQRSECV
jgi:hypothetical protein